MEFPASLYLHAFNLLPPFGPARLLRVAEGFENWEAAYSATGPELVKAGVEPELAEVYITHRAKLNLDVEWEKLQRENIRLLDYRDTSYPQLLREIPKFPPLLYYKGTMPSNEELCIAVVGTRKMTNYGRITTPQLVEPLVQAGVTIVSGLAYGVDETAHMVSVNNHARTIAVLGGGIDSKSIYPANHSLLADRIIEEGGAVISEQPIGTPNLKHHFISRNRIISGLSIATLVVECDLQSGALITAKHSLDQNRNVYAVPGPIYAEMSKGPNNLIKMGAKLVSEAKDILEDLNLSSLPEQKQVQMSFGDDPLEEKVLRHLDHEPKTINEIIRGVHLDAASVTSTLTMLEMKGKVRNLGGQQYILSR